MTARRWMLACLLSLLALAGQAQPAPEPGSEPESEPAGAEQSGVDETAPPVEASDDKPDTGEESSGAQKSDDFKPREEISEDFPVALPADI